MQEQNKIEIYQLKDKQTVVEVQFEQETVWLSQKKMAELFDKDVRTINEHIKTIYKTGELIEDSTIRKFRIVRQEGKRKVSREMYVYHHYFKANKVALVYPGEAADITGNYYTPDQKEDDTKTCSILKIPTEETISIWQEKIANQVGEWIKNPLI